MADLRNSNTFFQRCVIVHRDEKGYGLTVSGDNPVYVQSVKPNGAAHIAGVQVNDQIIKVNGIPVTQSNHLEVVRLITSGSFVALTLLGKDPPTKETRSPKISHSRSKSLGSSFNSHSLPQVSSENHSKSLDKASPQFNKVQDLERNLHQEQNFHDKILAEYMRAPSLKTQQELADSQTRINALKHQLNVLTGVVSPKSPGFSAATKRAVRPHDNSAFVRRSVSSAIAPGGSFRSSGTPSPSGDHHKLHPREGVDNNIIHQQSRLRESSKLTSSASSSKIESMLGSRGSSKNKHVDMVDNNSSSQKIGNGYDKKNNHITNTVYNAEAMEQLFDKAKESVFAMNPGAPSAGASIMCMEDDEFDSDSEIINDHGPFTDLEQLRKKPAHISVLLHFLMSNNNPSPLLFWLVADIYSQEQATMKELKKWAYEIYSTFIGKGPLKLDIDVNEVLAIEQALADSQTSEERLKHIFDVASSIITKDVDIQLEDFRNRRALGLGGLFGDHQLEDELDRNKELNVIQQTLVPHLEALLENDVSTTTEAQMDKNKAMAAALATFMKSSGLKSSGGRVNTLEKCRSFVEKNRKAWVPSQKNKITQAGHKFFPMQYTTATLCGYCDNLLWGIGNQGLHCAICRFDVHPKTCLQSLTEPCVGEQPPSPPPPREPEEVVQQSIEPEEEDYNITDVESEIPVWQETLSSSDKKILKKVKTKEIKRQEVIHELIHTEKYHVRTLKVLYKLFYRPLSRSKSVLSEQNVKLIFPNLEEIMSVHIDLLKALKDRQNENVVVDNVGDIMVNAFGGEAGIKAKEKLAIFSRRQKYALEQVKKLKLTNKDFGAFMIKQESHPLCRRLQFTQLIAPSYQRLTKYPLLLERILKQTSPTHDDYKNLERSAQYCKDVLSHVNNEIKESDDQMRLDDLNKRVEDKRGSENEEQEEEGGKLDFTKHKLICEGDLEWRISPRRMGLRVVLLNDILVLLQKQDDRNKYILKNHVFDNKTHKPVIKVGNIIIRDVAVDKKAFFLVDTSKSQIYEFGAQSESEQKSWVKELESARERIKGPDKSVQRGRRDAITIPASSPQPPNEKTEDNDKDNEKEKPVSRSTSEDKSTTNSEQEENINTETEASDSKLNLPSKERMAELNELLIAKDDAIRKLLEEKNEILEEMSGRKRDELYSPEARDNGISCNDMVFSAIAQVNELTTSFGEICSRFKDDDDQTEKVKVNESFANLNEILSQLMVSIQSKDKQVETLQESVKSQRSTIERMKNNSESDDAFHESITSSMSLSPVQGVPVIHEEENQNGEPPPPLHVKSKSADGGSFLPTGIRASPFGFRKRPSDPTMEKLSPSELQVNRASSFSGSIRPNSSR